MRHLRAALSAALVMALATTLVPGIALADDRGDVGAQGTTYDIDAFDAAGMGDDTPGGAHDITANIANYGGEWYENHTLDIVDGTTGDVDWVRFTISEEEAAYSLSYLFRTQSAAVGVDTVIEIYGPGTFSYTQGWLSGTGDSLAEASNDEDAWRSTTVQTHDSALLFRPVAAGTYYVRIRPYSWDDAYQGEAGPYRLYVKRGVFQRVYGANRIETAVAVSEFMCGASELPASTDIAVVVADAYNYPDALTGSVLAGISDGVLLLTPGDVLAAGVGDEIVRLGAKRVYVVGGSDVVSDDVFSQIQALDADIEVHRVEGDDRCMTATEIALQAQSDLTSYPGENMPTMAIIAYGWNFPDALAAAAFSAARNVPILLTNTPALNEDAEEALFHLGTTDVVIVGEADVVSTAVEDTLKDMLGDDHVLRIGGTDRYETAKMFASWAADLTGPGVRGDGAVGTVGSPALISRLSSLRFGIASGENFPDALSGGAACGLVGVPLLLTRKSTTAGYIVAEAPYTLPAGDTDWVTDVWTLYPTTPFQHGLVFGGEAAITESTMLSYDAIFTIANLP